MKMEGECSYYCVSFVSWIYVIFGGLLFDKNLIIMLLLFCFIILLYILFVVVMMRKEEEYFEKRIC